MDDGLWLRCLVGIELSCRGASWWLATARYNLVMFQLGYRRVLWLFLLPYGIGMTILITIPALSTAVLAFTEYDALSPPTWVGGRNFGLMFTSPVVRQALFNSLFFVGAAVPLRLIGGLLLALLLNRPRGLVGVARTAVFIPTLIPAPAYALIGLWFFNPVYGPLNLFLGAAGLPQPAWLTDPWSARWMMVFLAFFQLGEGFILFFVALQTIPRAYYDLARLQGASWWQMFWYITLPFLRPWLLLFVVRDLLLSLQNSFVPSYMITYGGPYYATTFVPLLVYEIAFDLFDLGLAAAVLLLLFAVVGLLIWNVWQIWGRE